MKISGNIVDVVSSTIYSGSIIINNGKISAICREDKKYPTFIIPGLVDAHVHIESSMLTPAGFARMAVLHGTVASVSDPHEIANVLGAEGVEFMIENGKTTPFDFYFGAPSCVPATSFETSGAAIDSDGVEALLERGDIFFMSEMMNFPGVIRGDGAVLKKIGTAKRLGKPVDGHAPGLMGEALEKYINAGISTDHETFRYDEGLEKLSLGMKLLIREGSAAKNFDVLSPLITLFPEACMFCSDDRHPDDLATGHIDEHVRRGLAAGIDIMTLLRCACVNPMRHYGLNTGLLQIGDFADFVEVDDLEEFTILRTFLKGEVVAERGKTLLPCLSAAHVNRFGAVEKVPRDFEIDARGNVVHIIEAASAQIVTGRLQGVCPVERGKVLSDPEKDILKIAVVNRYKDCRPAVGFVKNFGLKKGAMASSVAHDSHNIVAVGVTDEDLCKAVNVIIRNKGGMAVVSDDLYCVLPLPIAGLMSDEDGFSMAEKYSRIDLAAKQLGSSLDTPFMTLSFMALLVIPKLKLSDRGLFDGDSFRLIDLFSG